MEKLFPEVVSRVHPAARKRCVPGAYRAVRRWCRDGSRSHSFRARACRRERFPHCRTTHSALTTSEACPPSNAASSALSVSLICGDPAASSSALRTISRTISGLRSSCRLISRSAMAAANRTAVPSHSVNQRSRSTPNNSTAFFIAGRVVARLSRDVFSAISAARFWIISSACRRPSCRPCSKPRLLASRRIVSTSDSAF